MMNNSRRGRNNNNNDPFNDFNDIDDTFNDDLMDNDMDDLDNDMDDLDWGNNNNNYYNNNNNNNFNTDPNALSLLELIAYVEKCLDTYPVRDKMRDHEVKIIATHFEDSEYGQKGTITASDLQNGIRKSFRPPSRVRNNASSNLGLHNQISESYSGKLTSARMLVDKINRVLEKIKESGTNVNGKFSVTTAFKNFDMDNRGSIAQNEFLDGALKNSNIENVVIVSL